MLLEYKLLIPSRIPDYSGHAPPSVKSNLPELLREEPSAKGVEDLVTYEILFSYFLKCSSTSIKE